MSRPVPTRRAVLTSVAGLGLGVVASACRFDPASSGTEPSGAATPEPTRDDLLLDHARRSVEDLHRSASMLARRHPELRPLVRVHAAHLRALDAPARRGRSTAPSSAPAALRTRELAAARDLTDWAVRAESGSLATLFATIAASIPMFYEAGT